ncbi:hypothetical protein BH23CHL7_BH23CHL7_17310 [soil metagenome]
MTTFRSPRYPALAVRTAERYFKFAGGQLEVSTADTDIVRDWVSAHPAYGVTETKAAKRARTEPAAPEPSLTGEGQAEASAEEGAGT